LATLRNCASSQRVQFAENRLVLPEIDGENVAVQVQPSGVGGRRLPV
jgi:hypothetical protein